MSKARARKVRLILFDVDGVLTDGTIWLFPSPVPTDDRRKAALEAHADKGGFSIAAGSTIEAKGFHAHDGIAFSLARLAGIKTGMITKRISETVALRARDLKVDHVYQGQADKLQALEKILAAEGLKDENIAYVGDDIIDLPVMRRCGLALAVANARDEVKRIAHWVSPNKGGEGAARDAVEYILRAQGRLKEIIQAYLDSRPVLQETGRLRP